LLQELLLPRRHLARVDPKLRRLARLRLLPETTPYQAVQFLGSTSSCTMRLSTNWTEAVSDHGSSPARDHRLGDCPKRLPAVVIYGGFTLNSLRYSLSNQL
jgi:hypothetical protein